MHTFLGCTYNSQDFAQPQENSARSHDHETVKFRNSDLTMGKFYYEFNSDSCVANKERKICDKNSVCSRQNFTPASKALHRHACDTCDKFQVCKEALQPDY